MFVVSARGLSAALGATNMKIIIGLVLCITLMGEADCMFWQRKSQAQCGKLINAVLAGKADEVQQVLEEGADANCRDDSGSPAIIIAASRHERDIVKALLSGGADPNITYNNPEKGYKKTPAITFPAANGDLSILSILLSAGADVNARDATGATPLMSAAFMGHEEVIKSLIERGAKTEEKDDNGYTALMFAANAGQVGTTKALLHGRAQVSARDNNGSTPIMFAAQHGYDFVVMLLLSHGADPRAKGNHGLSAIGFAKQNNHAETLRILENPNVIAVVKVDKAGGVYLNGRHVTASELAKGFAELKKLDGTVWYYRENPELDAPPQALEVIRLAADAQVSIVLLAVDFE
jgi:uncharacterized protein